MLCDDVLLIMVEVDGLLIVGVMNMIGVEMFFGCYWGCI